MLDVLGEPVDADCDIKDAVACISSLTKVQKLDFWLRNPDYLADELLTEFEDGRATQSQIEGHVQRMLQGPAPSLHTYPMERYLYGAYEFIDNALAVLKMYKQITYRRVSDIGSKARKDVYLLERGRASVENMRRQIPELAWYDSQADAIALIADSSIGATAKRRQYRQPEYQQTAHGDLIPSILERVRQRAAALGIVKDDNS